MAQNKTAMANYNRNFTVRTSRPAGKKQRDYITLLGGALFVLKHSTEGKKDVPAKEVLAFVKSAKKYLAAIDKYDQNIWHQLIDKKNDKK